MQTLNGKKRPQNALKIGFGKVLGSIWEGSGKVWGVSWTLLGAAWLFFECSKTSFFTALAQDGLQEAFWIDLGCFLEGSGKVLGRIWEGLGRILANFGMDFGEIWGRMNSMGHTLYL